MTWADVNNTAAVLQILGLAVSIATLARVQSVRQAQRQESAALRGVHVRVLGLSSQASDAVLEQASMVLPWPKADPATLRRQLQESEERIADIVAGWRPQARSRFEYRRYEIAPNVHFVRIDGLVRTGFLGTLANAQPSRLDDRGYIELPLSNEPGATLLRHFDELWQASSSLTSDAPPVED